MPFEANLQQTEKKRFYCSYLDEISIQGMHLRAKAPVYQKNIASNYVTIKTIFSYTVVQPRVTNVEYAEMRELGFTYLENTSDEKAYQELMNLIDWSYDRDERVVAVARKIFEIRVKELKYILANTSKMKLTELEGGYRMYDKYLEFIAG